jgi:hypothetical protein
MEIVVVPRVDFGWKMVLGRYYYWLLEVIAGRTGSQIGGNGWCSYSPAFIIFDT